MHEKQTCRGDRALVCYRPVSRPLCPASGSLRLPGSVIRTTLIGSSRRLIEQRLRLLQVGGVEAFRKPALDRGDEVAGSGAPAMRIAAVRKPAQDIRRKPSKTAPIRAHKADLLVHSGNPARRKPSTNRSISSVRRKKA
jgi:hypothetical protein